MAKTTIKHLAYQLNMPLELAESYYRSYLKNNLACMTIKAYFDLCLKWDCTCGLINHNQSNYNKIKKFRKKEKKEW